MGLYWLISANIGMISVKYLVSVFAIKDFNSFYIGIGVVIVHPDHIDIGIGIGMIRSDHIGIGICMVVLVEP